MIEEFQHRDWAGIPHETFCHCCVVLYLVIHFTRTFDFSGSLVLYMCKVSVGSVRKILLVLTQSHYVV